MAEPHVLWIRLRLRSGRWIAPPTLRKELVRDARKQGIGLNDLVVVILSAAYRVPCQPSGRTSAAPSRSADAPLNLRIPTELWRAIGLAAAAADSSRQREAVQTLSGHYGLKVPAR